MIGVILGTCINPVWPESLLSDVHEGRAYQIVPIKHIRAGHYRPASETPFNVCFAGGPIVPRNCMLAGDRLDRSWWQYGDPSFLVTQLKISNLIGCWYLPVRRLTSLISSVIMLPISWIRPVSESRLTVARLRSLTTSMGEIFQDAEFSRFMITCRRWYRKPVIKAL